VLDRIHHALYVECRDKAEREASPTAGVAKAENPRLVIIDTLAMVRAPKGKEQTQYDADYTAVLALRELASTHGLAIVVVHAQGRGRRRIRYRVRHPHPIQSWC
jgi:hypothetical protein